MAAIISLLTTGISLFFALRVGQQYLRRKRSYQLLWSLALFFYSVGAGCQLIGELLGWNVLLYRLWYLTGAILTAAYLGQGSVYLQARRRLAHGFMWLLFAGSILAIIVVFSAPADLNAALAGEAISGAGFPRSVRLLTPFFNIFGTLALVGGALKSSWFFLWNGKSVHRAAGTTLIATGALVVAAGGTFARFSFPEALYLAELIGITGIFTGYQLTNRPVSVGSLAPQELFQHRKRVKTFGVGISAASIFSLVAILPILPWAMKIVTPVKHIYTSSLPADNKGAYLMTDQGVMQLYSWQIEPAEYPSDAPWLDKNSLHAVVVIQKQFDTIENYRLYNLSLEKIIPWQSHSIDNEHLQLEVAALEPGDYILQIPTDSMYGGVTYHYFRLY